MRKKIVAGNWKMHGSRCDAQTLMESVKKGSKALPQVNVVILPPFVHLQQTQAMLENSGITWGGQNLYLGKQGAFTGEISGPLLVDYGCQYVLVGHSERRIIFLEDLTLVAAKFKAALDCGLIPILCVGESLEQRESQKAEEVISQQLESVIELVGIEAFNKAVIAYEPVWAIGTGLTATPQQAQEMHQFIRQQIGKQDIDIANKLRILYGGSVKADNAAGLFAMPDIDGGLVGGASLDAGQFLEICRAACGVGQRVV